MKYVTLFFLIILLGCAAPALAQRDVNTSSARAAYNMPTGYAQVKKAKKKKKAKFRKNKTVKIKRKEARKNSTDAARHRRKSLFF